MSKHYSWLWFDADGTLFDFHSAEAIALKNAIESVNTLFQDDYLTTYRAINQQLWLAVEKREITPTVLQARRFELLIEALQLTCSADLLGAAYIDHLAAASELFPDTYEVVQALHANSRIAIVTNGLQKVQHGRLSPIREFIDVIVISEEVGAAKPEAAFFEAASERTGHPPKSDILIIGDSLAADMQGGIDYGIDTCWYNPAGTPRPRDSLLPITYEIAHLRDLLTLVEG